MTTVMAVPPIPAGHAVVWREIFAEGIELLTDKVLSFSAACVPNLESLERKVPKNNLMKTVNSFKRLGFPSRHVSTHV